MQTINQLTANISNSLASNTTQAPQQDTQQNLMQTQQHTTQDKQPSEQLTEAIRVLFQQWKAWFKNKMKTKDDDFDWSFDMVLVWARYLTKKGITAKEFALASELSFDEDWMPNNAKEFLSLTRQSAAANYPDMRQAYLQAAQGSYKHEVILETAKRVGEWEIKSQSESITYRRWQEHYPVVCNEHSQGASFKVPVSHQVEYKHQPVAADSAMSGDIADFFAEFGSKKGEMV